MIERLPKPLHASVRRALRQAWEFDDADKAERLLRNLTRRLEHSAIVMSSPQAALDHDRTGQLDGEGRSSIVRQFQTPSKSGLICEAQQRVSSVG